MKGAWTAFLDRDGTINEKPPGGGYVLAPDQLRLNPGACTAIRRLNEAGWRVVSSALTVRGVVPGSNAEAFRAAAESTRDGCPISVALAGNVALSVEATLEG